MYKRVEDLRLGETFFLKRNDDEWKRMIFLQHLGTISKEIKFRRTVHHKLYQTKILCSIPIRYLDPERDEIISATVSPETSFRVQLP